MAVPVVINNDEIVAMMQRMFPHEARIVILTISNQKLMDEVNALGQVIEGQRAEANDSAWRNADPKELK